MTLLWTKPVETKLGEIRRRLRQLRVGVEPPISPELDHIPLWFIIVMAAGIGIAMAMLILIGEFGV